jgi:hypothetical protein
MPVATIITLLKRPSLRWKHLSSRDLYIYSELSDSDCRHSILIPSIVTGTAYTGTATGGTPSSDENNSASSTSTIASLASVWKLLRIPSLILSDESEEKNENDPGNSRSTKGIDRSSQSTTNTTTTSNSFLPESLAETETLDQMFRLLERLDGRRSRNYSWSSRSRNSSGNNSRKNHNNDDDDDGRHSLLPKVALSQSYDTADTDVEEEEYTETSLATTTTEGGRRTNSLWFGPENTQTFSSAASAILQHKGVTWADQPATGGGNGNNESNNNSSSDKRLVTRFTYTPLPEQYLRVVILLLHPVELKFEFVHAEYDTDVRLTVAQVLKQLSRMAVNPELQGLEWGALCLRDTHREMINCMTLQEYNLYDGSMLIAVPIDYAPRIILEQAGFFLTDKVLRRVVRRAKMTGQSPQRLQANPECNKICSNSSDTSDTDEDEDDDHSAPEVPQADFASVLSSLSFDASFVVNVPSIQDDDFDDFWSRVHEDSIHATNAQTATTTTSKSRQLADHVPAAFERFFAAADEDRASFDFTGDLVRLAPLPRNPVVEVQVQPPESATTPSSSSSSEPAVESTHKRGHSEPSPTASANATTSLESSSALGDTTVIVHATNETTATNEDLSACSPEQEEDASTFAGVLDVSSDKLRLVDSF